MTATAASRKRPLITANMVTFARLIIIPLVGWFIYLGESGLWAALVLGTFVGCTDFVDGYLARKHGPTVLGGLMDPIADKVFIAVTYLPFLHLGLFPVWWIGALFARELIVTALRTAYKARGLAMKTSYLAKVKTWVQMMGVGLVFLFVAVRDRTVMWALIGVGVALPLVAMGAFYLVKKRLWRGALVMSGAFIGVGAMYAPNDLELSLLALTITIVAITWLSGIDYLVSGIRQLRGVSSWQLGDLVRIAGAASLPFLIVTTLVYTAGPPWAIIAILAIELSVGGLDNLLAHHKAAAGPLVWGVRVAGTSVLLGLALTFADTARAGYVDYCVYAAFALTMVGATREFWRGRDYYIDARLREQKAAAPRMSEASESSSSAVTRRYT